MIPTSIDGTDITGATIDGTDVTEITVDGDTVFSAQSLPVAFSDMIAWYPMEPNISGGNEYSDATALFSGAADSTPYDLVDDGAVFEPSEGVTDINNGQNSGAFENVSGGQFLTSNVPVSRPITISFWYYRISDTYLIGTFPDGDNFYYQANNAQWNLNGNTDLTFTGTSNVYTHVALSVDASGGATGVFNRNTTKTTTGISVGGEVELLNVGDGRSSLDMRGYIDDVRFYNTDLSVSQIQDIYDNTLP